MKNNYFNEINFNSEELLEELTLLNNNKNYLSYNKANQNGEIRDTEDIKIKVAISNLLERKISYFISSILNVNVYLNQFGIKNTKPELADFSFNYKNMTLTGEIRTSDIVGLSRQLNCSLIGNYKNNIKKSEPDKDIYLQVFWNQSFEFIKTNLFKNNNFNLSFNLCAFAFKNDFSSIANLNQNNTKYFIIKPITKAHPLNNFLNKIEEHIIIKSNEIENKLNFKLENIINKIKENNIKECLFLEDFNKKSYFFRILTHNNLNFDIEISNIENQKNGILFYCIENNLFKTKFNFVNPLNGQIERGLFKFIEIISNIEKKDIKYDFTKNIINNIKNKNRLKN